ncbi:MAG: toxin-antitoxin system HicB family antitoxin [Catonella sp.]
MNKATTVRLPESLKVKLKQAAVKRGMTLNNLVIQLLWESVNGLK